MLQANEVTKKPISIRLDEELYDMLDKVQSTEGTVFWDRDRTWLIEHAIKEVYGPVVANLENGEAADAQSP